MSPDKKTTKLEYKDFNGNVKKWEVVVFEENSTYLIGIALPAMGYRTFRKDRIVRILKKGDHFLDQENKTWVRKSSPDSKLKVCFTEYNEPLRVLLNGWANEYGLQVCSDITDQLDYLVADLDTNPVTLAIAEKQGTLVLDADGFQHMLHINDDKEDEGR